MNLDTYDYRLVVFDKRLYREAVISKELTRIIVGTGTESHLRFQESDFFARSLLK